MAGCYVCTNETTRGTSSKNAYPMDSIHGHIARTIEFLSLQAILFRPRSLTPHEKPAALWRSTTNMLGIRRPIQTSSFLDEVRAQSIDKKFERIVEINFCALSPPGGIKGGR